MPDITCYTVTGGHFVLPPTVFAIDLTDDYGLLWGHFMQMS